MRKQGFTLVELLAVLVVLAVILAIAVPAVSNIIRSSTMKAFENDAKMVLNAIRLKEIEIDNLNPEEIDETNIDAILGLSNANYDDLEITIYNNEKYIAVRGKGKWAGFSACGTFRNIRVNEGECFNDFEDPVITLLGDNPVTINIGDTYVDAGATATDDNDEDIVDKIVVTGEVNVNQVGTYIISYDVTDNSGRNAVTVTRTVHVIDINNPVVTFGTNGNAEWAQTRSTTVTVSDAGGVDNSSLKYLWNTSTTEPSEGSFSTTFTSGGTINSPAGVTGGYYLWILAKDTQGNTTITRTEIFNLDNTPPVITMNGDSSVTVAQGGTYTDAGATASDEHSGVGAVTPTGTVNVNNVGTYTITYNVTDNAGNAAVEVVRTINVVILGGTTWTYEYAQSGQTFTVPATGMYTLEMHGGGGGGGGGYYYTDYNIYATYYYGGNGGGGSGQIFTDVYLIKDTQYLITIGAGGTGGKRYYQQIIGGNGGTTSFGSLLSVAGGKGADCRSVTADVGKSVGILSTDGGTGAYAVFNNPFGGAGGQGNITNTSQTYGDGGTGGVGSSDGQVGSSGAIIITYNGPDSKVYSFTNAGATGKTGPNQTQLNNAYAGTSLEGQVTTSNGIQLWTVPLTGTYKIEAWGAGGGISTLYSPSYPGRGTYMKGTFSLTSGTQLKILVGQRGNDSLGAGGGGGGSFVTYSNNTALIVAGGGSGAYQNGNYQIANSDASAAASGKPYNTSSTYGAGGGGLTGNGNTYQTVTGGSSFTNGGVGGTGYCAHYQGMYSTPVPCPTDPGAGGFGGGGGSYSWSYDDYNGLGHYLGTRSNAGSGGGGGYSGGSSGSNGGGGLVGCNASGGGGSYNNGSNKLSAEGVSDGHGRVIITYVGP